MRTKRTFSPEERLSILQEGQREGQTATCRKCHIPPRLVFFSTKRPAETILEPTTGIELIINFDKKRGKLKTE